MPRIKPAPEYFVDVESLKSIPTVAGRRKFLRKSLAVAGLSGAGLGGINMASPAFADEGDNAILKPQIEATSLGKPVAAMGYGQPSRFEQGLKRRESPGLNRTSQSSVAFTPLQGMFGIITPTGLHFERHHSGWFDLDPSQHRLMIDSSDPQLLKHPSVFTMDDLMRLPSVSRMHFIECGANTGMEWGNVAVPTVQYTHGMLSCGEFTGVPIRLVLEHCGADFRKARYVLAEGGDGSSLSRTIPMELIESGEVLLAWGMNGEMLRPENGYPLRLVVPGVQGVSWVKWLRRIEVGDMPYATREEAIHYTDMLSDGMYRQYTSIQECKSVITSPSGGQMLLDKGHHYITGLAWSGRGVIRRVDVSTDGGKNWQTAQLQTPILSKCLTRFGLSWHWRGQTAILQSRAVDSTGYVQPTRTQLVAVRGTRSIYHNNAIQSWRVSADGEVGNVHVS